MKMKRKAKKLAAALALGLAASSAWGLYAAPVQAKSLWLDEGEGYEAHNIFVDRKARHVGDIVTIVITENTTTSQTKSTSNSKSGNTQIQAGIGIFDFLKAASAGGSDSFKADGSASNTAAYRGNVTVTVTEVQPNGNMVLEGTQSIWQNRDEHKITFRGICRQDDVTANNTIPSTKIADATVRFDGKGPLNAKQRQGILTQIFNFLF